MNSTHLVTSQDDKIIFIIQFNRFISEKKFRYKNGFIKSCTQETFNREPHSSNQKAQNGKKDYHTRMNKIMIIN